MNCNLCPRACNVDRQVSTGFCSQVGTMQISKVMLHYGEEPFLTHGGASGAIFFAGCNLKCVYCQNYQISNGNGKNVSVDGLISLFKQLEAAGAQNIDLVTPTHFADLILKALKIYKPRVPVIYNCGGYESANIIEQLCQVIDIFLFDLKYCDDNLAIKYSKAPNYFSFATTAITTAIKLKPNIYKNNQLIQGVAIRHLCLPSHTTDSLNILNWIANTNKSLPVSIMSQYVPMHKAKDFAQINRPLKPLEYKIVVNHAKKIGLNNALIQELCSNTTEMLPNFNLQDKQFKY